MNKNEEIITKKIMKWVFVGITYFILISVTTRYFNEVLEYLPTYGIVDVIIILIITVLILQLQISIEYKNEVKIDYKNIVRNCKNLNNLKRKKNLIFLSVVLFISLTSYIDFTAPNVELKNSEFFIKQNTEITQEMKDSKLVDVNVSPDEPTYMTLDISDVDTKTPGIYSAYLHVIDKVGNRNIQEINIEVLKEIVTEKTYDKYTYDMINKVPETPAIPAKKAVYENIDGPTYSIPNGVAVIGEDVEIPSGTYDMYCTSGSGNVFSHSSSGRIKLNEIMSVEKTTLYDSEYNNYKLEQGDEIESDCTLKLVGDPTKKLVSPEVPAVDAKPAYDEQEQLVVENGKEKCFIDSQESECGKLKNYDKLKKDYQTKGVKETISEKSITFNNSDGIVLQEICYRGEDIIECSELVLQELFVGGPSVLTPEVSKKLE